MTETPDSPRILLIRPGVYDPNLYKIEDILKVANMINDILMLEDDNFAVVGNVNKQIFFPFESQILISIFKGCNC